MSRTTITYCGVTMLCTYDYEPGFAGDSIDPPYAASAEISSILIGTQEALDLFDDRQFADIQALVLHAHADEREAAEADHWDNERKERALEQQE